MPKTTKQLRQLWSEFECGEQAMVVIPFGPDRIRVAPPAADAFSALAAALAAHDYEIRTSDTDSYNCREITNGSGRSLHSYGIALDVNWGTNPFQDHGTERVVRFSSEPTQELRARDVRLGKADTDMTPEMIGDVEKICTRAGTRIFEWGGRWKTRKDCMHFEIDVSPEELAAGIDPDSIARPGPIAAEQPAPASAAAPAAGTPNLQTVIARSGLRLRTVPSLQADVAQVVPFGAQVHVLEREGDWALVDLEGDGQADGFMSRFFLKPVSAAEERLAIEPVTGDVTPLVTAAMIKPVFPATPITNIETNLPFVLAGMRSRALGDRTMVAMALATIRAETAGFMPIDEGQSRFNTRATPFDLYEPGTSAGDRIGNVEAGDGARFKGRGYVQLTGRFNYRRISGQIGVDLLADPTAANEPETAGIILAQFLKNQEGAVRTALAANDLKTARKRVNGGTHGFERFRDAYERGITLLPS